MKTTFKFLLSLAFASVFPISGLAQLTAYVWQEQTGLAATPGAGSGLMAYDPLRQVCILIQGSDTWLWDGHAWTHPVLTGSQPQNPAGMVFDTRRNVAVLFCTTDSQLPGNTWEWNGSSWRLVSTNGLTSRTSFGMAYDSKRGRTVAFGGNYGLDGPEPAWTWEWDGVSWSVVATNGLPRRDFPTAAFDERHGVTILFGGRADQTIDYPLLQDTWAWDGSVWTQVGTTGPARESHAMIYDSVRGRILLFAGDNGANNPPGTTGLGDTWEWDGSQWSLSIGTGIPLRYDAGMAYDIANRVAVVFGGRVRNPPYGTLVNLQDTWLLALRDIWVDYGYGGTETGDFTTPFRTLGKAVSMTAPASFIKFKAGHGVETLTVSKSETLTAPSGAVTIGK